jgi:hypothetical protein
MNLCYNLAVAEMAVAHVGSLMKHGASNKAIDLVHSTMYRGGALKKMSVSAQRFQLNTKGMKESDVYQHIAAIASKSGIGNCAEQAALAFNYLSERVAKQTLCLVTLGTDHVCVLIAAPGDYTASSTHAEPLNSKPDGWPGEAVVCDPWYHEWFSVRDDWSRKVRSILRETWPADVLKDTVAIRVIDRKNN